MSMVQNRKAALRAYIDSRKAEDPSFSATEWSRRAGVSEGTLRNFLTNPDSTITLDKLDMLAAAENVPLSLILGEGQMFSDKEMEMLRLLNQLPDQKLQAISELVGDGPFLTEREKGLLDLLKTLPDQKLEVLTATLRALQ